MTGKIIKGIAGFYYVHVAESGVYECKAKGIFRNRNIKPTVGDDVEIEVLSEVDHLGNINEILPRKNILVRPAVTNVDQAIIIFALKDPVPNLQLLDKFLIQMNKQRIPVVICFNKSDLIREDQIEELMEIYGKSGAQMVFVSAKNKEGIDLLFSALKGNFLNIEVSKQTTKSNWNIIDDYCFGGYAKTSPELLSFIQQFEQDFSIPLEQIYTGKMLYGIFDLIQHGYFTAGCRILVIHSGGLQGRLASLDPNHI